MARREARKTECDETSLADLIRQAARESGLSIYQLAIEGEVDQSTLNKFLNGTRPNIRLDVADRLFQVLGIGIVRRKRPAPKDRPD